MTDKPTPADTFRAMSDRIERNDPKEFAGAYVIVAPDGTTISHTFINPEGDNAAFWGFISAAVEVAGVQAVQKQEGQFGGMNRRR